MASKKSPDIPPAGESEKDLDENKRKRSVLITNIPPGTTIQSLIIYFQKTSNGGGEVDDGEMLADGKAVVIFDEEEVAHRVLQKEHTFEGTLLKLEPSTEGIEVFSLVSAKLDASRFTVDLKKLNSLLIKAREETGVDFIETCEGFMVSGTLEQIDKSCSFLSRYAKPPNPERDLASSDNLKNGQSNDDPLSDSDDEEKSLEAMVLDIEPKLMHILQKQVNDIEKKYKMKIDWKRKPGKAHLSPNGKDSPLFDQGKEEFITLYQKEFQDLKEKDFTLDTAKNIADLETTTKALMKEFAVVIERKGEKDIHIFGKENHVTQVMQRLQGKFGKRRTRKAYKEPSSGELPMPDTHAQAAMLPLSKTLENGVVVSVHQGDITKVQVDVIVNAANEYLDHGGGVAGAIVKQGGRQIQQESDALVRRFGRVPVGQVAQTGPGNLPYKLIFHAVGPQWKVNGEERSRQLIFDACINSFTLASKQIISSIALPGISSGIYGVPKTICAEIMFAAAEMFSAEASSDNQLKDIRFVNIDTPTYEAFRREFHNRYGLMKGEEADVRRNPYQENIAHPSYEVEEEREYQKGTYQQRSGSTGKTDHVDTIEESERKKRANAAARRMGQVGGNEAGKDGEKPREHDVLLRNASSKNSSDFVRGFEDKEKRNQHPPKGKEQKGMASTKKIGNGKEGEEEKKPEPKSKEKISEKDNNNKKKTEVEKRNKKENEKDNPEKPPVEDEKAKELTDIPASLGIKDDHSETEDTLRNSGKMETNESNDPKIADTKIRERVADKTKLVNSITENRESGAKKDFSEIAEETEESLQGIHKETNDKSSGNELRASDAGKLSGRGVTYENTPFLQQSESKTLKSYGRGKGARAFAPTFADAKPGRAVRQDPPIVDADSRKGDNDSSEGDPKVPPGLIVSQEGLELAQTAREKGEEGKLDQEEDSINARKKHLERESKDATDGVPSKKARVDEGTKEKKGEGSTKQRETMANDIQEHEGPASDKSEKENDKKEIKEEITTDVSGSDESDVSKKSANSNDIEERKDPASGKIKKDDDKKEIKEEIATDVSGSDESDVSTKNTNSNEKKRKAEKIETVVCDDNHLNNTQKEKNTGIQAVNEEASNADCGGATRSKKQMDSNVQHIVNDQSSHPQDLKDESSAVSTESTQTKESLDSKVEPVGDVLQSSHQNVQDEISIVTKKATGEPEKPLDSKVVSNGDDQSSDQDAKHQSITASAKAIESKKLKESKEQPGGGQSSHKDLKDESSTASAESTEPKKPIDSEVENSGDGQSSHHDEKDETSDASAEATEPEKPKGPKDERIVNSQSSDQDKKDKSRAASLEKTIKAEEPSDSKVEDDGNCHMSVEKAKEESSVLPAEATDSETVSDFSAEPASMNSFVVLDMPSMDLENPSRSERTSGSSDESSESIELLEHPGRDEFSGSLPSSPINDQEDDHAKASKVESTGPDRKEKGQATKEDEEKEPLDLSIAETKDKKEEDAATGLVGTADIGNGAESGNQGKETASETRLTEDVSQDEEAGSMKKAADSSGTNTSVPTIKEYQDCGLCYEKLDLAKALKICDHLICENCVTALRKTELSNTCPICHKAAQIALQPVNGQMKSGVIEGSLSRHEGCATLYIDYDFPDGIQGPFHPHPGTPYDELSRRTFLPDNEEGREVLELLQKAFDACILFTVGKSMINEKDNQIIFNADIEHKININGGPTVSGYPDPEYLDRVKKQLKAKEIE